MQNNIFSPDLYFFISFFVSVRGGHRGVEGGGVVNIAGSDGWMGCAAGMKALARLSSYARVSREVSVFFEGGFMFWRSPLRFRVGELRTCVTVNHRYAV